MPPEHAELPEALHHPHSLPILRAMAASGPCQSVALAPAAGLGLSSTSEGLARLRAAGLARRTRRHGGRLLYELTDAGREALGGREAS